MRKLLDSLNLYFETVPDSLRAKRIFLWLFFILVTVFLSFGIPRVNFDMTLESWFAEDDPTKIALSQFRDQFGSDDGIYIVYKAKDGDILSQASLEAIVGIREDLLSFRQRLQEGETSKLEHVTRVETIASANVLQVDNDTLISRKFIGKDFPQTQSEREALRRAAWQQKNFPLLYFSKDFQYGGISIQTDLGTIPLNSSTAADELSEESDEAEQEEDEMEISMEVDESAVQEIVKFEPIEMGDYIGLMEAVEEIIYKPEYTEHLEYFPVGNAPMMKVFMEMMEEMGPLFTGMLVLMAILLWILFRSLSGILWPITIVILSSLWVTGLAGWSGIVITSMITLTVLLIMAVGVADSVHILSAYLFFRNEGQDHESAMRSSFKKAALPCMMTSLTTMVGMLALTLTSISHIKVFGYSSALGVVLAFLFTAYLLPLMMDLWPPVSRKYKSGDKSPKTQNVVSKFSKMIGRKIPNMASIVQKILDQILPLVEKRPGAIVMVFALVFAICIYGATRVRIDTNIIEATKEGSILRQIYQVVDTHMMGTQNLEIYLDLGKDNALQDPAVLIAMEQLQAKITEKYSKYVVRTYSLADVVKEAYQVLNEDRKEMYLVPTDKNVLAQTLFLFNNANPEDRRKLVSDDYSKSHISVQLYNAGSLEYTRFFAEVQNEIEDSFAPLKNDYPQLKLSVTGGLALMMELTDYISWTQLRSISLAIGIISLILIFVFGSYLVGLLSILPNLLPSALTFGLLGLFNLPLDSDTIIIAPVIIGIAVDDTIHFITHYRGEVLKDGKIRRSLENTIREVGQAITFTTLILGCGFAVMAFSSYMSLVKVGIFGSLAIFVALISDLLFLPALILIFKPRFLTKEEKAALS